MNFANPTPPHGNLGLVHPGLPLTALGAAANLHHQPHLQPVSPRQPNPNLIHPNSPFWNPLALGAASNAAPGLSTSFAVHGARAGSSNSAGMLGHPPGAMGLNDAAVLAAQQALSGKVGTGAAGALGVSPPQMRLLQQQQSNLKPQQLAGGKVFDFSSF